MMKHLALTLTFITAFVVIPHRASAAGGSMAVYANIYKKAKTYYKEQKYTAARALFMEVKDFAKRGGTYAHIIDYRIGLCYESEGNKKRAIKHFRIYLQAPSIPKSWPTKASVQQKISNLSRVIVRPKDTVDKAKARRQRTLRSIAIQYKLALKYMKARKYSLALVYFKEVRRKMLMLGIHSPYIDLQIGATLAASKKYQESLVWFRRYVNTTKPIRKKWPSKASIRKYMRKLKVIIARANRSNNLNTSDARVIKMKTLMREGYALLKQGNYLEAVKKFRSKKRLERQLKSYNHYIDYYIAYCYDLAGKPRMAVFYYKLYLKAPVIKSKWPSANSVAYRIQELTGDADRRKLFNSGTTTPPRSSYNPYASTNYAGDPTGNGANPRYGYSAQDDNTYTIFGLKWYYWVAIAGGIIILAALMGGVSGGTNDNATYKKSGARALSPGALPHLGTSTGVNLIRF